MEIILLAFIYFAWYSFYLMKYLMDNMIRNDKTKEKPVCKYKMCLYEKIYLY